MNKEIRHIVREVLEAVMSASYNEADVSDAIMNKHFIHTKNGKVYSPVKLDQGVITGVADDCEHYSISIDEVSFIQSSEDRFSK